MDFIEVHAVDFPCVSGLEGLGNEINNQYDIASYITVLVIMPDRQIVGQFYEPDNYPTQDTINNLLLSLGAEMLDCNVGVVDNTIDTSEQNTLQINPNPIGEKAEAIINIEKSGLYEIRIFNNFGAITQTISTPLTKGENTINLDFSLFSSGIYYISLKGENQIQINKKILKQ